MSDAITLAAQAGIVTTVAASIVYMVAEQIRSRRAAQEGTS